MLLPAAFVGARPAAGRKTKHDQPGDTAGRLANRIQGGTEEKAGEDRRRDNKRDRGQNFEPRRGAHP